MSYDTLVLYLVQYNGSVLGMIVFLEQASMQDHEKCKGRDMGDMTRG